MGCCKKSCICIGEVQEAQKASQVPDGPPLQPAQQAIHVLHDRVRPVGQPQVSVQPVGRSDLHLVPDDQPVRPLLTPSRPSAAFHQHSQSRADRLAGGESPTCFRSSPPLLFSYCSPDLTQQNIKVHHHQLRSFSQQLFSRPVQYIQPIYCIVHRYVVLWIPDKVGSGSGIFFPDPARMTEQINNIFIWNTSFWIHKTDTYSILYIYTSTRTF